jgi:hypothetical protein
MCTIVIGLELPLVEFEESPHTLLELCSPHKDKVEIKCVGCIGGKTPTELEIYSPSNLRHNKIDVFSHCSFISWVRISKV